MPTTLGPRRLAAALVGVVAVTATLGSPAGALRQERVQLGPGEVVERDYGTIAGNNPANEAHLPTTCDTSAYCDTIPITITPPPDIGEDDEYFVRFDLEWDSPETTDPTSGEVLAANDLDMFIYNDPIVEDAGPDEDGVLASGATQKQPERANLFRPAGDYAVVIVNFVGVNTGYTVRATYLAEGFEEPFELLGPPPRERPAAPSEPTAPRSPAAGPPVAADPTPAVAPPVTSAAAPPTTALVAGSTDADADLAGEVDDDFESSLGAPAGARPIATRPVASADEPSTLAVLLSLAVAPVVAAGAGGAWLLRRRATTGAR